MNRTQAIGLAQLRAADKPESYVSENFQPHEWVICAIQAAYKEGYADAMTCAPAEEHELPGGGGL